MTAIFYSPIDVSGYTCLYHKNDVIKGNRMTTETLGVCAYIKASITSCFRLINAYYFVGQLYYVAGYRVSKH